MEEAEKKAVSPVPGLRVRTVAPALARVKLPVTLRVESMVEEALTNIPAVVEVGVKVLWPSKATCQEPGEPAEVHPDPVTDKSPTDEACTQEVAAEVKLSRVTAPVANRVPFSLVAPTTPRVVVGRLVPTPTLFSEAFTTRVLSVLSTIRPERRVLVAVAESTI